MLKKIAGGNYFVALIVLLLIVIVMVAAALILVTSFPGALAELPPAFEIKEIYHFEPWSFEVNSFSASFPQGGIIAPLYREDKLGATLFLGKGEYRLNGQSIEKELAGAYLLLNGELFDHIRGDILFIPVEDIETRTMVHEIFEKQSSLPVIWEGVIPLSFIPKSSATFFYFLSPDGSPDGDLFLDDSAGSVYAAAVVYAIFTAVVIAVMLIFSLDHKPSRFFESVLSNRPTITTAVAAAGAAFMALIGELLPHWTGWPHYSISLSYFLAAGILITLLRFNKIDFADFGLRQDAIRHGYLMAVSAAVLYLFITRGVPQGFNIQGLSTLLDFILIFFLIALAREAVWRGYIQVAISRFLGAFGGLAVTAALAGLVQFLLISIVSPHLLTYPYTVMEYAVLAPGAALVLGYLYLRTENIISCALLHTLIVFLPGLIIS